MASNAPSPIKWSVESGEEMLFVGLLFVGELLYAFTSPLGKIANRMPVMVSGPMHLGVSRVFFSVAGDSTICDAVCISLFWPSLINQLELRSRFEKEFVFFMGIYVSNLL